jgi:hypothetical protein
MIKKLAIPLTIVAISASLFGMPTPARAGDGGAVVAGAAGGLLGGMLLGSALAGPRYYEAAPVYVAPPPRPPYCYWTHGRPYWDGWRGVWVRPRIRVCE